ncbi:MAG TPA: hypothetical protein VMS38_09835, partial [Pseudorhodoferax sp.]|nr:hypothetical protein [Pseudorhodoferax sp.]
MKVPRHSARTLLAVAAACIAVATAGCGDATSQAADSVPFGGPLAADLPLAKAYDDAARALAESTDNPILKWEYRIWCQTGYRTTREGGTGQPIDQPVNPDVDLVSPTGFVDTALDKPMPEGGVRFMDNAWYFGTRVTGMVVVRNPDGSLLMFDALTNARDMQAQTLDQMRAAHLVRRASRTSSSGTSTPTTMAVSTSCAATMRRTPKSSPRRRPPPRLPVPGRARRRGPTPERLQSRPLPRRRPCSTFLTASTSRSPRSTAFP